MRPETIAFTLGFFFVAAACIYALYRVSVTDKKTTTTVNIPAMKAPRSWAAAQLRLEFFGLPATHRPEIDIESVINALDTKYEIESVNRHFNAPSRAHVDPNIRWSQHGCATPKCPFMEYVELHLMMQSLHAAYVKREYAFAVAEQQHGFEQMQLMKNQLVSETLDLIDQAHNIHEKSTRESHTD